MEFQAFDIQEYADYVDGIGKNKLTPKACEHTKYKRVKNKSNGSSSKLSPYELDTVEETNRKLFEQMLKIK